MKQLARALAFLAALLPSMAAAQTQLPTLPPNTVLGRLGVSSGPAQAIPFSVLSSNLTNSLITLNSGNGMTAPGAMAGGNTYSFGANTDTVRMTGIGLGGVAPATGLRVYNAAINPTAGGQGIVGGNSTNGGGLIGQGSIFDSYLGNNTGSVALGVTTGTQNVVLQGTLTAASLSTAGTIGGSLCATSAGLVLYKSAVNCFAVSGITVVGGKTLTVDNTIELAGTDGTKFTYPGTTDTLAGLGTNQTFTGNNTFSTGTVNFTGTTQLNGTAFGTFATQNFATPPAIGGTTPNTGAFSTLSATTPLGLTSGGTNASTAAGARSSTGLNIDALTSKGDTNYTMLATDRTVGTSGVFTSPRTWTLPAASAVNAGQALLVQDFVGGVSNTNTLTVSRAGSDTINGGATTIIINSANGGYLLISNGVSNWSAQALGAQATSGVASINGQTGSPSIVAGSNVAVSTTGGNITVSEVLPASGDKVVYVSTTGNDSSNGLTPSSAKLTLQAAVNAANPNGIVRAGAGTFTLAASVKMQPGVRLECVPGTIITQAAATNLLVFFDFTTNTASNSQINFCKIDGNSAANTNASSVLVNVVNSNNVTLTFNTIVNCTGGAISISSSLYAMVEHNNISGCPNFGIAVIHSVASTQVYAGVRFNTIIGPFFHGIQVTQADNVDIVGNTVDGGTLIGDLTTPMRVNVAGTAVTWVSGPTFSGAKAGTIITFNGGTEGVISTVNSTTSITLTATGGTVSNVLAAIGSGDVISLTNCSYVRTIDNYVTGGVTGGIVLANTGGSFASTESSQIHTIALNLVNSSGQFGIALEAFTATGSPVVSDVQIISNTVINPGRIGAAGAAPLAIQLSSVAALMNTIVVNGNAAHDYAAVSGGFWLGNSGTSGATNVAFGVNTNSGFAGGTAMSGYPKFASLPAITGYSSFIIDANTAFCGDGTCMTWATQIGAGGGALIRQVFYNGSTWTMTGK